MELLTYKRDSTTARGIILNLAKERNQVIYGARSVNKQLPVTLRKPTQDYDVLTKQPEKSAKILALKLNKEYGKEKFKVVPAKYSKTFKVKDIETGETIADYTRTTKKPKSKNEFGVKYAGLHYQESKIKKVLKDESSAFRHDKDFETLQRIKQARKIKII
jgi:hypothetical protein